VAENRQKSSRKNPPGLKLSACKEEKSDPISIHFTMSAKNVGQAANSFSLLCEKDIFCL